MRYTKRRLSDSTAYTGARHYSLATDVCGRLVEVLCGTDFDTFLQVRWVGLVGLRPGRP